MRHLRTDPADPYAIVKGLSSPLTRDKGLPYATVPKPEHNPYGGTTIHHATLDEARARNAWAREVRSW